MKRGSTQRSPFKLATVVFLLLGHATTALPQSLRGDQASLDRQNRMAQMHNYTYLRTAADVERFVHAGYLERVRETRHLRLEGVSFPYARPEVRLFLERISRQYYDACQEALVVTSLTRPQTKQPRNASPRSVHPTGMAVDLRRSRKNECRQWLERVLLQLEKQGVLEATYEQTPPHYHVAVFPRPYMAYLNRKQNVGSTDYVRHTVKRGESLWTIARQHNTTVKTIQTANNLKNTIIRPGQILLIPLRRVHTSEATRGDF